MWINPINSGPMIPIATGAIFAPAIAEKMRNGMSWSKPSEQPKKETKEIVKQEPIVWAKYKPLNENNPSTFGQNK